MIIGRIEVGKETLDYFIEYSDWEKMKAQIELENNFETPFKAFIYTDNRMPETFTPKETSQITYILDMIPDDAETNDRFFMNENGIKATYFNPQGGIDGLGEFMEHHFSYDYILQCENEIKDDEAFLDALYGDACRCPTYCIDIGTDLFGQKLAEFNKGQTVKDNTPHNVRQFLVKQAQAHQKKDKSEYELKIQPVIYLTLNADETKEQVLQRAETLLNNAGFTVLSGSMDNKAEIRQCFI